MFKISPFLRHRVNNYLFRFSCLYRQSKLRLQNRHDSIYRRQKTSFGFYTL